MVELYGMCTADTVLREPGFTQMGRVPRACHDNEGVHATGT